MNFWKLLWLMLTMNLCRELGLALRHPLRQCGLHTDCHGLLHKWINQPYSLIFYTSESSTQVDLLHKRIFYTSGSTIYAAWSSTQVNILHKWIFYTSGSTNHATWSSTQADLLHKWAFYKSGSTNHAAWSCVDAHVLEEGEKISKKPKSLQKWG